MPEVFPKGWAVVRGKGRGCACQAVLERLAGLEGRLLQRLTASPPRLLLGWSQISYYCGKSPRTLRRYRRTMGFPAYRWGRGTVSSPALVDSWLVEVARQKRERICGSTSRRSPSAPTTRKEAE
jgi:hypothetical protein